MFFSILFPTEKHFLMPRCSEVPGCFRDLNLDQVISPILKERSEFELESFYYTTLHDVEVITYRQEVMKELEGFQINSILTRYSKSLYEIGLLINTIKLSLTSDDSYRNNYLARGHMLDCAESYCNNITSLSEELLKREFCSDGLTGFSKYLSEYIISESFTNLEQSVKELREEISSIDYCMLIKNGTIRVRKYEGQENLTEQIIATFDKFRQGQVNEYRQNLREEPHADHVEAAVLDLVAELHSDVFSKLNNFCVKYDSFIDENILQFSREVHFYLAWFDLVKPIRESNLPLNYPKMESNKRNIYIKDGFDLALASIYLDRTVTNDILLKEPERIIVVTGPNQGGKTTFARSFGQIHYLASLGVCVPGSDSELFLFDDIFTHFGREEDLSTLNGKLQDDLVRLHDLLYKATSRSILIINEIFSSTTLSDAIILGSHMMEKISVLGAPTVIVTFLDELAAHGSDTVSMMSTVDDKDPTQRTFKVIRKPPDGLAYAIHLAKKNDLTYDQLIRRLE